jgi:hypothetical protein
VYGALFFLFSLLLGVWGGGNGNGDGDNDNDNDADKLAGLPQDTHNARSLLRREPRMLDPVLEYGWISTVCLYALRSLAFTPLFFSLFNCLGVVLFSVFPTRPRLQRFPLLGPFICFRVVTRGTFPQLVRENVQKNLQVRLFFVLLCVCFFVTPG